MNWLSILDIVVLFTLWWVAAAALEGGNEVNTWSRLTLAVSLIGIQVCSIIGALTLVTHPVPLPWWIRGILYSGVLFAVWFYERRFGVLRHLRMARSGIANNIKAARSFVNGQSKRPRVMR